MHRDAFRALAEFFRRTEASVADRLVRIAFLVFLAALVGNFARWAWNAVAATRFAYELDYGEGIVWEQARLIFSGAGYSDINEPPYFVFHYPPVFHIVSELLALLLGTDQLAAGRLVSIVSTVGIAIIVGALTIQAVRPRLNAKMSALCGLCAALMLFAFFPIASWSLVDRVDMLGALFALLGAYFGLRAVQKPWLVSVSALCFDLALYSKQTLIAAPIATFVTLLIVQPRLAWRGCFVAIGMGALGLLTASSLTDGRFLQHLLLYNLNRLVLSNIILFISIIVLQFIFVFYAIYFFVKHVVNYIDLAVNKNSIIITIVGEYFIFFNIYFIINVLLIPFSLKNGAYYNYFAELFISVDLIIYSGLTIWLQPRWPQSQRAVDGGLQQDRLQSAHWIVLCTLLAFAGQIYIVQIPLQPNLGWSEAQRRQVTQLIEIIRKSNLPVISQDMVLLRRAGKDVFFEPGTFVELTATGQWDEHALLDIIRAHKIAFFITMGAPNSVAFHSLFSPAVAAAINKLYPRKKQIGGYWIHLPPQ